jgi:hypothetical protein
MGSGAILETKHADGHKFLTFLCSLMTFVKRTNIRETTSQALPRIQWKNWFLSKTRGSSRVGEDYCLMRCDAVRSDKCDKCLSIIQRKALPLSSPSKITSEACSSAQKARKVCSLICPYLPHYMASHHEHNVTYLIFLPRSGWLLENFLSS